MSKAEIGSYFEKSTLPGGDAYYSAEDRKIHYAFSGYDSLPVVVFVHGAPGSLSAFIHFLNDSTLSKRAKLVTVDRPGYGYSGFGRSVTSLEEQARLLKPVLELGNGRKVILVGHSLGGPVVARMAMDYPNLVDGLILVAPSIAPELEPEEWFRLPLYSPFLRWILPKSFRVTNDEIYFLKDELIEMLPLWKAITIPVTVIQGGSDNLVHPGNAEFAQKNLSNALVEVVYKPQMNHFVPWNNYGLIKTAILKHLNDQVADTSLSQSFSTPVE